ncbi:MAG TPA: hypothetical protein VG944_14180 [Fimbriimonas sp.]|nr:hypothetical protein [Fimbriimonas sp.]
MKHKLFAIFLVLGIAALSPAPIRDISAKDHELPALSPEQMAANQQFNGRYGVVGSVPLKTNEDGTAPDPVPGDATAASTIASATPIQSNPKAVENLTHAKKRLNLAQEVETTPWLLALVLGVLGFGAFQGLKVWMDKNGPAPKQRSYAPSTSSSSIKSLDDI